MQFVVSLVSLLLLPLLPRLVLRVQQEKEVVSLTASLVSPLTVSLLPKELWLWLFGDVLLGESWTPGIG